MAAKKKKAKKRESLRYLSSLPRPTPAEATSAPDFNEASRIANARITGAQSARVNDFVKISDYFHGNSGAVLLITAETAVALCAALRRGGQLRDGSWVPSGV